MFCITFCLQDALDANEIAVTAFTSTSITVIFGKREDATGYSITLTNLDGNSPREITVNLLPSESSRVTFDTLNPGVNYEITLDSQEDTAIEQRTSKLD